MMGREGNYYIPDISERLSRCKIRQILRTVIIRSTNSLVNPRVIQHLNWQSEVGKKFSKDNIPPPLSLSFSHRRCVRRNPIPRNQRYPNRKEEGRKKGFRTRLLPFLGNINMREIERRNSFFRKLCVCAGRACFFGRENGNWSRGTRPRKLNFAIPGGEREQEKSRRGC